MQPNVNAPTTKVEQPKMASNEQLTKLKGLAEQAKTQLSAIRPVNTDLIGTKIDIPTQKKETPRPTALDTVGTTPTPKTGLDTAREAILNSVKPEDRDVIDQILQVSTGLQTEQGKQLEGTMNSLLTDQLSNIRSTRDRALESSKMKEAQRLPELEAELESIRGENDVLTARRNAAIQAEERRQGVSTQAMQGNVARINRDFDLEQANLAIRELASVGKINAATKLIDTKLDLKYGDLEAESKLLTAQLTAIAPFLSREDQKAAEMRLQLNEVVKAKIEDARASDKALEEFKLQSYIFAQQNGASPAVLSNIMSSTSREDVASVGGSFIQDPMVKAQLEATRALTSQRLSSGTGDDDGVNEELYSGLSSGTKTAVRGLVGKFSSEPTVQNFATVQEGYNFARSISDTTQNPADDQALIYSLAKALDPGSVVREGEYATAQKYAQSWIQSYGKSITQAINGTGFLSIEARKNIKNVIESKYKASLGSYQNLQNQYSQNINSLTGRNDGNNFLIDYSIPVQQGPQQDEQIAQEYQTYQQTTQNLSSGSSSQNDDSPGFWKTIGRFFFGD